MAVASTNFVFCFYKRCTTAWAWLACVHRYTLNRIIGGKLTKMIDLGMATDTVVGERNWFPKSLELTFMFSASAPQIGKSHRITIVFDKVSLQWPTRCMQSLQRTK